MKKIYFVLMLVGVVLTSCGGDGGASNRAGDLCDCFKDAGIDFDGLEDISDLKKVGDKMEKKKGQKCVLSVLEGIEEDISDLNDKETGDYMRDLIKAMLDTECVSEGMEDMEFDDMKKGLKKEIKRMKKRMKNSDDDDDYGYASAEAGPAEYYDDGNYYEEADYYEEDADSGDMEFDLCDCIIDADNMKDCAPYLSIEELTAIYWDCMDLPRIDEDEVESVDLDF